MRLKIFSILSAIIVIVELVLCFAGPMVLVQRPSLMVFPIYYYNLEEDVVESITQYIEISIAETNSFKIVGRNLFHEYLEENKIVIKKRLDFNYKDAAKAAAEMGLDRFVISTVGKQPGKYELSVSIRETESLETLKRAKVQAESLDNLLTGIGLDGKEFSLKELINIETKGISLYDWIFFMLLAGQFVLAVLAYFKKEPGNFPEVIAVVALLLFLFAYIYALNANMDYVQRFILTKGQIALAKSTAEEQLYAVIRFFPLLLLNFWYYFWKRLGKKSKDRIDAVFDVSHPLTTLKNLITPWALLWTILSAVLYGLAHPSFITLDGIFIFGWIGLIPLFLVFIYEKPPWAVFHGVTFGALQTLIINFWHGTYDYISLHLVIIVTIIQYIIFMIPLVWIIKKSNKWGFLFASLAWVSFDYLRGNGLLGYPWGIPGASQYPLIPVIQIAALTGVWGISFIVLLFNTGAAWVLAGPGKGWEWLRIKGMKKIFPLAAAVLLFIINLTGGLVYLGVSGSGDDKEAVDIVLIQQNTDPRKHVNSDSFENLTNLTTKAIEELGETPDLIVWSECAFAPDIRKYANIHSGYGNAKLVADFLDFQKKTGAWLVTGNQDHEPGEDRAEIDEEDKLYYNASVLFDPRGNRRETFHKIHLVPFTEYFPWKKEMPKAYEYLQKFDVSDWTPGKERVIFQHDKFKFITPICFEDVFPNDIRLFVKNGVDIIVNMSNDYWSLSPVEGKQHGINALFRAVENQRPLVRATASGYTVHIDSYGRIQPGEVGFYTMGYTLAKVKLPGKGLTLYTMFGDWFPVLNLIIVVAVLVYYIIQAVIRTRNSGK